MNRETHGISRSKSNDNASWRQKFNHLQVACQDPRLRAYYAHSVVEASTPIFDVPLVAMDFETTGLDPATDEIVSIGLVPLSLQRVYCRHAAHWLVKPAGSLPDESVVIHGITHSEVGLAPDFQLILGELLDALAGKVVVVHYRHIERGFLSRMLMKQLGESIQFPVIDTFELERRAMEARRGLLGRLLGRPLGSLRLGDARQRYSLPAYQPHHALTDALATAELLQAQIAHHHRPDRSVGDLWC